MRIQLLPLFETGESKDLRTALGIDEVSRASIDATADPKLFEFVNLKLAARGLPIIGNVSDYPFLEMGASLLASLQQRNRRSVAQLCPADRSIHEFFVFLFGRSPDRGTGTGMGSHRRDRA